MKNRILFGALAGLFISAAIVYADGANVWQYDAANKFLTNSTTNWKIPIAGWSNGVLVFDRDTLSPKRLEGSGDLDLRDLAVQTGDAEPVKVTRLALSNVVGNRTPFYSCKTLTSFAADNVDALYNLAFDQCTELTNVILSYHPNFISRGNFPAYSFRDCSKLTCDVSQIIPANISVIGANAFRGTPVTGTLKLDKVTVIGDYVFQNSNLSAVEINGDLTSIGAYTFDQNTSLISLSFGCRNAFTVGGNGFRHCPIQTISFAGTALTTSSIDNMLIKVSAVESTEEKGKSCIIYASRAIDNGAWKALAAPLLDNESKYCPRWTYGVYRDGSRKAWLVHHNSPFDTKHSIFTVR